MTNINDRSTVPIFAVLCVLPFGVAFVMWLASVDAKASQGAKAYDIALETRESLIRLETYFGTLPKKKGE